MFLRRLPGVALGLIALLGTAAWAAPQAAGEPRVSALYTTWDDFYFYAGFQVRDPHVVSTNDSPTSQPQQDDDIEVFFETDNARANVRTTQTYQMAVSAANGAYFSVGTGGRTPKARAVYSYKYAARVDGTLNDNSDTDTGFTVELAIPWQELGLAGPPKQGTTWGFNVISRDRDSTARPATRLYSLSPDVKRAGDVQDPSKWARLVFGGQGRGDAGTVVSPHVVLERFPLINGSIVSGEWQSASRLSFGTTAVEANAPTLAEEPNTGDVTFQPPPPLTQPLLPPTAPTPPVKSPSGKKPATVAQLPGSIDLPNGAGVIRVLPGGSKLPPPTVPSTQEPAIPPAPGGGPFVNPLTPKPPKGYKPPTASTVSLTGSLTLTPAKPASLVMAVYRVDYNADGRKAPPQNVWDARGASLLTDQPINSAGPWFSGLRPLWHRQQLSDLRRAGIDVALLRCQKSDPLLGRELDALVEALQEMKARRLDYPLIGVDLSGGTADVNVVFAHVPAEFRATVADASGQNPGLVVYATDYNGSAKLDDGTPLTIIADAALVSPGRADKSALIGRSGGKTYADSWQKATEAHAPHVVIDSWNDFSHGTEICGSRQYGEKFADDTRLFANAFNGSKEWHAKYLTERAPRTVRPKALYQVPVRVVNAGTLPWRAGEGYALAPRWYKDGRLYDDSAPRVPVGTDVFPGQSVTLSVGLVARNAYGDDLDPGDYTLVFDMVQGQDRWFSYAGDIPLQVAVTVTAPGDAVKPQAVFLGGGTPTSGQAGAIYATHVSVRNDGGAPWSGYGLAYKLQSVDADSGQTRTLDESAGQPLGANPIQPGQVAEVDAKVALADGQGKPLPPGEYRLHWFVRPAGSGAPVAGDYDESLRVVASDPGVSFSPALADVPRTADAGREFTGKLAVQNIGPTAWTKGALSIGYHWYFLDGQEAQWDGGSFTPLPRDVPAGGTDAVSVKVRAPDRPGRYALVWDARNADGVWASTAPASRGDDLLPMLVTVSKGGAVTPVDLSKYASSSMSDFDDQGHALPAEMLPPDGTSEVETNPLLLAKPGPPLYPSGYYAQQTGRDWQSNHGVSFLYPVPRSGAANVISCQGQTIDLPGGDYKTLHLLAAATGGQPVKADFGLRAGRGTTPQTVTIADWTQAPSGPGATVAFRSPYRIGKDGAVEAVPCLLGDYALATGTDRVTALVLPNNPAIKILAVSLEK